MQHQRRMALRLSTILQYGDCKRNVSDKVLQQVSDFPLHSYLALALDTSALPQPLCQHVAICIVHTELSCSEVPKPGSATKDRPRRVLCSVKMLFG